MGVGQLYEAKRPLDERGGLGATEAFDGNTLDLPRAFAREPEPNGLGSGADGGQDRECRDDEKTRDVVKLLRPDLL